MSNKSKPELPQKTPQNTFQLIGLLIKGLFKGFIGSFVKNAIMMLIVGGSVFIVHLILMIFFNEGFQPMNNGILNSIIVMRGVFLSNLVFYFLAFAVIPMLYRNIKKNGIGEFSKKIKEGLQIGFELFKKLLDKTFLQNPKYLFSLSLGILVAAVLSPFFRNPFTAALLLFSVSAALVNPGESFLTIIIVIVHRDIDRAFIKKGKKLEPVQIILFLYGVMLSLVLILAVAILKIFSFDWNPTPFDFIWFIQMGISIAGVIIAWVYKNRNEIPDSHIKTYGKFFVMFLAFTGMAALLSPTALAHDFGWRDSGGTIKGVLSSPGAPEGFMDALSATLASLSGLIIGSNMDGKVNEALNSQMANNLKTLLGLATSEGGKASNWKALKAVNGISELKLDAFGSAVDFLTDLSNNLQGGDSVEDAIRKAAGSTGMKFMMGKIDPATGVMSLGIDSLQMVGNLLCDVGDGFGADMSKTRSNINLLGEITNPGTTVTNSFNLFHDFANNLVNNLQTGDSSIYNMPDDMRNGKYGTNFQNVQYTIEGISDFVQNPVQVTNELVTGQAALDAQNPIPPPPRGTWGSLDNR